MSKTVIRYSEAFKMQVLQDLETGRANSVLEVSQMHGIKGATTVHRWIKQYGRENLMRRVVRVEKPGEPGELKRLKDRVRKLEEALADAHMDGALDRAFFELLCEDTKTDPEAFKKKADLGRSTENEKA